MLRIITEMNFLALEQKFKEMDKREADMRAYFDPLSTAGRKHKFIKDLKADYEFDNLIYGLGKYVNEGAPKPRAQHLEMKVEDTPKAVESTPSPTKKSFKAKLRNPTAFHIIAPLTKEVYEGVFSNTRIIKPEILNEKKAKEEKAALDGSPQRWVAREVGSCGVNPAAQVQPMLAFPKIEGRGHRQAVSQQRIATEMSPVRKVLFSEASQHHNESLHSSLLRQSNIPSPPSPPSPAKPLPPIYTADTPSDKLITEETMEDTELSTDALVMKCSKQVQSPFSDNPLVYFEVDVPKVCIKLLEDVFRDLSTTYTLQLTDLSVVGYPIAKIEGILCDPASDWLQLPSGEREIDLKTVITDYKSVQQHTLRLVLFANNEKRRLIERLLFFGAKDWKSEAKVVFDLERFRAYLKEVIKGGKKQSISFGPKKDRETSKVGCSTFQCLLQKVQRLREQSSIAQFDLTDFDPMKITTPRRLQQKPKDEPEKEVDKTDGTLPALSCSPKRKRKSWYKHPITHGLMNYRAEDLQYKHELYAANLVYLEDQAKYRRTAAHPQELSRPDSPVVAEMQVTGMQLPQGQLRL